MVELVDTNVVVRFLVGDNVNQKEIAAKWFWEAQEGRKKLWIKSVVVAETCFVLESVYKLPRKRIADALMTLVGQKWIGVEDRDALKNLWPLYIQGLHWVDSCLLATIRSKQYGLLTFDKELLRKLKSDR
jgi:predicted nucleic-acid-binding protein